MVKVVCLTALKTGSSSRMTSIRRRRSSACTVSTFRTTPSITETLPPLSLAPRAVPEMPGPVAQGAARINPPAECFPLPRGASGSVCPHRRLLLPGGDARIAARGRPLPEPPAEPRRARPQGPLQALGAGHSVDDAEPAALADAAADRRRERALDADHELLEGVDGVVGEPVLEAVEGLLAGVDLHPGDAALAFVRLVHGRIEDRLAGAPDVGAGAVALDEGEDGVGGDVEAAAGGSADAIAGGDGDDGEAGHALPQPENPGSVQAGCDRDVVAPQARDHSIATGSCTR